MQRWTHVFDVKERRRKKKSLFWNISEWCIILYHRGGMALLLIQSLWKNIYIAVFIRAARRFYASFKKGSWYTDRRAHEVGEEIAFVFFLSLSLSRHLWCSVFLVIILKTVVSGSFFFFFSVLRGCYLHKWTKILFLLLAAFEDGGIIVGSWEKVNMCACVCVVHV